jgi:crotonobetaine/carnitine-CoA ligase
MTWTRTEGETLITALERQADRHSDKVAVYFGDDPVTYGQLLDRSRAAANRLLDLGVGPGDTVGLLMENCEEQITTLFATAAIGAVEVSVNTAYRGEFLRHQLANAGAAVVLVDHELAPSVLAVSGELPALRTLLVRGAELADAPPSLDVLPVTTLLEGSPDSVKTDHVVRPEDPSSIVYTSGTTGPSKGAVMTQNYMVHLGNQLSSCWYREPDDVIYACTPLFHLASKGCGVLGAVVRGATCVLDQRFSVTGFWDRTRQYQARGTFLIGGMLMMLWNQPEDPSDADVPIRTVLGAPIPAALQPAMERRWNISFSTLYAVSEAVPLTLGGITSPLAPGTAGKVNDEFFEVRLFDQVDREVPTGDVGEIVCRPLRPNVMFEGYYRNPEATVSAFRNLWFHTGDLGRFDAEGNLSFVDRQKDYIRRRGENISSVDVEQAVTKHPAVTETAAVAIRSELTEDEVKVCVTLRPDVSVTHEELLAHCIEHIPYFAVPRYIEMVAELPRTPSGRVEKYRLREAGVTEQTWDCEAAGYRVTRSVRSLDDARQQGTKQGARR